MRILLIEDDAKLAERTAEYLRLHDIEIDTVADGEQGLLRAKKQEHELILLDIMLPGIDGLELCKQLRASSNVPIIMLSARGEEVDRIVGLELGADDYLAKPFSPRELLARIRAVMRRHADAPEQVSKIEVGPLNIDRDRRRANVGGTALELTAYQFDLLWVLATNSERVLSRGDLFKQVRKLRDEPVEEFDPSVDRSIDVHLSKVRQALATHPDGEGLIRTVRGVGYVLSVEEQ